MSDPASIRINNITYALAPAPEGFAPDAYVDGIPCIRCGVLEVHDDPPCRIGVPMDTGAIREAACLGCPSSTPKESALTQRTCELCGCRLASKLINNTATCPAGKWPA